MPSTAAPETILRLTQETLGAHRYQVEVTLEAADLARLSPKVQFDFDLDDADAEEVRWYLED